jgi:hypothetical protein
VKKLPGTHGPFPSKDEKPPTSTRLTLAIGENWSINDIQRTGNVILVKLGDYRSAIGDKSQTDEAFNELPEVIMQLSREPAGSSVAVPGRAKQPPAAEVHKSQSPGSDAGHNIFRKNGDVWEIVHGGVRLPLMKNLKGLAYIACLLRHPGREFTAHELETQCFGIPLDLGISRVADADDLDGEVDWGDSEQILDSETTRQYRERLEEIPEEIESARASGDDDRESRLENEREQILNQLRTAIGLGGRHRRFNSESERARARVTQAITVALDRIGNLDSGISQHLCRPIIRTGSRFSYNPGPNPPDWITS